MYVCLLVTACSSDGPRHLIAAPWKHCAWIESDATMPIEILRIFLKKSDKLSSVTTCVLLGSLQALRIRQREPPPSISQQSNTMCNGQSAARVSHFPPVDAGVLLSLFRPLDLLQTCFQTKRTDLMLLLLGPPSKRKPVPAASRRYSENARRKSVREEAKQGRAGRKGSTPQPDGR